MSELYHAAIIILIASVVTFIYSLFYRRQKKELLLIRQMLKNIDEAIQSGATIDIALAVKLNSALVTITCAVDSLEKTTRNRSIVRTSGIEDCHYSDLLELADDLKMAKTILNGIRKTNNT